MPAPPARLLRPAPLARLLKPAPPARLLGRLPPCRPTCCRALAWRLDRESPRAVPPNLSAVARSRYGAPPRCCGLCFQLASPRPPPPSLPRSPPPIPPRSPPRFGSCDRRFPPPKFELRLKLLLLLIFMLLLLQPQPQPQPP